MAVDTALGVVVGVAFATVAFVDDALEHQKIAVRPAVDLEGSLVGGHELAAEVFGYFVKVDDGVCEGNVELAVRVGLSHGEPDGTLAIGQHRPARHPLAHPSGYVARAAHVIDVGGNARTDERGQFRR